MRSALMRGWRSLLLGTFLSCLCISNLEAKTTDPEYKMLRQVELEDLAEPIALYPDKLLQPLLPASTFPDQIVDASLLIKSKKDAPFIEVQDWDESVKLIATYPGVLKMMSEKITWTTQLGQAFLNQREDLFSTIQSLRQKAQDVGNLKTNEHQTVTTQQSPQGDTIIVVQPTDPEVVYVPETTSTAVYTEPGISPWVPLATFGAGLAIGAALDDDDDDYYGGYWGGGPSYWYDHDNLDKWQDNRRAAWEDHNDRAWDRQEHRQDMSSNRQDFRQDQIESGNWQGGAEGRQARADQFKSNHPDAANRAEQRQQTRKDGGGFSRSSDIRTQEEFKAKNPEAANRVQNRQANRSGSSSGSNLYGSRSGSHGDLYGDKQAMQQKANQARTNYQNRSSSTNRSGNRSYSNNSAFQGYGSRGSTTAASNRGSMSRSRSSFSGGGSRSFSGGGRGGGRR